MTINIEALKKAIDDHQGPTFVISCDQLRELIDRLEKAEAQHADLLKSMFEIAWSNDSEWQTLAAKQACLRNPALTNVAATASDSEGEKG